MLVTVKSKMIKLVSLSSGKRSRALSTLHAGSLCRYISRNRKEHFVIVNESRLCFCLNWWHIKCACPWWEGMPSLTMSLLDLITDLKNLWLIKSSRTPSRLMLPVISSIEYTWDEMKNWGKKQTFKLKSTWTWKAIL